MMIYPNGDIYDGQWNNDVRVGRAKMLFKDGSQYLGTFVNDAIDMSQNGHVEDFESTMFRVMAMETP